VSLELADLGASLEPAPEPRAAAGQRFVTARFVGKAVLGSARSLVFVTVLNFFRFRVIEGDPVRALGRARHMSPEAMTSLQHTLGLDQPLWKQFFIYLENTAHGQFGVSYATAQPVSSIISAHLWPTIMVVGGGTILATLIGVWMGIRSAWWHGGRFDQTSTAVNLLLYSAPEWWLGLILLAVFAVGAGPIPGIFPTGGLHSADVDPTSALGVLDTAWHLALPVTTLALAYLAEYSLVMRSSLLDEMGEDYLQTARAKGLRDDLVRRRHAVPNAFLPTTTLIALNLGFVVSGSITIERVFSIDGLGSLTQQAIDNIDHPLLQGLFFTFSAAVIGANLVANLLYGLLDPRVRV
jgi:peptide/nickel transport system permease protein